MNEHQLTDPPWQAEVQLLQQLSPGRPDPPRRAEASSAKHRGDGGVEDVDPELQEAPL
jgi:hypothetical protein